MLGLLRFFQLNVCIKPFYKWTKFLSFIEIVEHIQHTSSRKILNGHPHTWQTNKLLSSFNNKKKISFTISQEIKAKQRSIHLLRISLLYCIVDTEITLCRYKIRELKFPICYNSGKMWVALFVPCRIYMYRNELFCNCFWVRSVTSERIRSIQIKL